MEKHKDKLDIELIKKIEQANIKNLKYLPFIGKNYRKANPKILLIGKSMYYDEKDKNWQNVLMNDNCANIYNIVENGFKDTKSDKFHRGIEKYFNINADKRYNFWSSISLFQLIENSKEGSKHRDTKKTRIEGFEKVQKIANIIEPEIIIVFSSAYKYQNGCINVFGKPEKIDYKKLSKKGDIRKLTYNNLDIYFFRHPSRISNQDVKITREFLSKHISNLKF